VLIKTNPAWQANNQRDKTIGSANKYERTPSSSSSSLIEERSNVSG
jgi:hypothetical protein